MEIYLDNSATTQVAPAVREEMLASLGEEFGNPSSLHRKGSHAEEIVKLARRRIAETLKVNEKTIFFTSGGTESNNLALIGTARAVKRRGDHIIISSIEHPSVDATAAYLEDNGFSVTRLPVTQEGLVEPASLSAALTDRTVLVSVMMVNNEVGSRQPVEALSKITKQYNENIIFHVDAVQGYGKFRIYPQRMGIDLLSVSGHKIHGPKGIGFLYVGEKVRLQPLLHGGEQQMGLRSGTENVPGIVGIGKAAELVYTDAEQSWDRMYSLKERLQEGLGALENVTVNGPRSREQSAPHIVSATFHGVRSEVLLHALEDKGIYVSAGSACSSHHKGVSPTLAGIGLGKEAAGSTLRFSLCEWTTEEEIDRTVQIVSELLPVLRRFVRR